MGDGANDDVSRVLIPAATIHGRVASLATEIEAAYADADDITVVAVLTGSVVFLSDLIRCLPLRMEIGYVAVSSYKGALPTEPRLGAISLPELRGRDVLVVDDILDTGNTLRLVQGMLRSHGPRSLRTATLLRKPSKAPPDVAVEFVGFDIEDVFAVGYGLDFNGRHRNLPYIAEMRA